MKQTFSIIFAMALLSLTAGACHRFEENADEARPESMYDRFEFLYYTGEDDKFHVYQWWEGDATGLYVYDESNGHTAVLPFGT